MVRVLIALDKFKGSLTAAEVCSVVGEYLSRDKKYNVSMLPLADGGEGTFEILLDYFKGSTQEVAVRDPLFRKINSTIGISADRNTAFIEMAKASGLQLLKAEERNPLITSSFGTGELIAHALENKVNTIILGIGGSATNDAGTGMASALGYRFFDRSGLPIRSLTGENLVKIEKIDDTSVTPLLRSVRVITLCDVKNPLTGDSGAARVFSTQKGATQSGVELLEKGMLNFENLLQSAYKFSTTFKGAGAAGGMGAGARFFLNAKLVTGMNFLSDVTSLEHKISECDIIITGEGKLDLQSLSGKVIERVGTLAKKHNKRVIALCGALELGPSQLNLLGVDECLVLSKGEDPTHAMNNARTLIRERLRESKILGTS